MCSLLRDLTVPSNADALNSLDDLLNSVFPIHVGLYIDAVSLPFSASQTERLMRKVHPHFGLLTDFVKKNRTDIAYIVPRYAFSALFLNMPYRILPGASINSATAPFRLNRPSPYGRFFEISFMRVMGAGAVDKAVRNFRLYEYVLIRNMGGGTPVSDPKPLSMRPFGVLFSVWLLGCVLGIISFVAEICLRCNFAVYSVSVFTPSRRLTYRRARVDRSVIRPH